MTGQREHNWRVTVSRYTRTGPGPCEGTVDLQCDCCGKIKTDVQVRFFESGAIEFPIKVIMEKSCKQ